MRSGEVYINDGRSWGMGAKNYIWSQTTSKTLTNTYYFYFSNPEVSTSYGPGYRWDGFSLRCLNQFELLQKNKVQPIFTPVKPLEITLN